MNRGALGVLLVLAAAAFGCSSSSAAMLRVSCTVPAMDNDAATCGAGRVLVPAEQDSAVMFIEVAKAGIRDSTLLPRGARMARAYQVPAGLYAVRAWAAARLPGGGLLHGCDTTATFPAIAAPATPGGLSY